MPIDPLITAALAVQSRKGVYALLLGSGVSRAADIPTGWGVIEDLIRKIAHMDGHASIEQPEEWYREKYGERPSYSALLEKVAPLPADRALLLKNYFEPGDNAHEASAKMPTAAHRAIAKLVRSGHIRVIITTNFDRLIEHAIVDEGIVPKVIDSEHSAEGMTPLQHVKCSVIKLHGDYLSLDTRNTDDELAVYSDKIAELLDKILTEYGLIVCGWSGEWDRALRNSIESSTRHRFSTYWFARGELSEQAKKLVQHRSASVVNIEDADTVFAQLESYVRSIDDNTMGHPLSLEMGKSQAKRFLSSDEYRIKLADLIVQETKSLVNNMRSEKYSMQGNIDVAAVRNRVGNYETECLTLLGIYFALGRWGDRSVLPRVMESMESVASGYQLAGSTALLNLQTVPVTYLLYTFGIGCCASSNYGLLWEVWNSAQSADRYGNKQMLLEDASARSGFGFSLGGHLDLDMQEGRKHKTPASEWMYRRLGTLLSDEILSDSWYADKFHRHELLLSMAVRHMHNKKQISSDWIPDGRFRWHDGKPGYTPAVFKEEIEQQSDKWPPIAAGMFGGSSQTAMDLIDQVVAFMSHYRTM